MINFSFPICVFDLETTDDPGHSVIELGAVMLDRNLHRVLGRFKELVKPPTPVSDFVTQLTGHTQPALDAAASWPAVAKRFEEWVERQSGRRPNQIRLAAWGSYFDAVWLRNAYVSNGLQYPFSGTCICVKSVAMLWAAASGRRSDKLSVSSCAKFMGIEPDGPYHRADEDASVTAEIFIRAVGDLTGGVFIDKKHVRVIPSEEE